jgi:hypothetical protein
LLDRLAERRAWDEQTTHQLPPGHPQRHDRDNLDAPLQVDLGAHGPFDDRARSFSLRLWMREHPALSALAGISAAALALLTLRQRHALSAARG